MKIVCISDTHGMHHQLQDIPEGDMLLHAGDIGENAFHSYDFIKWFSSQPHKYKIFIAGNHDRYIQNYNIDFTRECRLYPNIMYLEDSSVVVEGLKIFGSPWTRNLPRWAFQLPDVDAEEHWSVIDGSIDILITHGPAYSIGDKVKYPRRGEDPNVGCPALRKQLELTPPKLHVFGHIHEGRNRYNVIPGCVSINASVVDEQYQFYPAKAFEIEL